MQGWTWSAIIFAILTVGAYLGLRHQNAKLKTFNQKPATEERTSHGSDDVFYRDSDRPRANRSSGAQTKDTTRDELEAAVSWLKLITCVLFVLTVLCTSTASVYTVTTKNVGIVTTFGKPDGTRSNGIQPVWPWQKITEMDAAIQTDNYLEKEKDCLTLRMAHQATACWDTSVRWRLREKNADAVFQDYRVFERVGPDLVKRDLVRVMNDELTTYDPLAVDKNGNSIAPSSSTLSEKVTTALRRAMGDRIEVLNVQVMVPHFDSVTQGRINSLQAQIAQTRIAKEAQATADAQATANKKLAASVSRDPNVLVDKCLNTLGEMVQKGQPIPAGFTCWPGGSNTAVLAQSRK